MSDLLIEDVTLPDGRRGELLIREGRIAEVGPAVAAPEDVPRLAGGGRLALPGAIDPHVHFRTPGGEHKETLLTGARAAAKGGVTTVGDMPNTAPPTTTLARVAEKLRRAHGAPVNLLLHLGVDPAAPEAVREAAGHPHVKAVKIYLGPSTGVGGVAPDVAERACRAAAEIGLPVLVHAEDLNLIAAAAGRHLHDARHHHLLRPVEAELAAVDTALEIARRTGVRLYLCHVTSAKVLDRVEASGLREQVFVEVCPHHLLLSVEQIGPPLENRYRVNPPLRPEAERAALFAALAERIDGLGSDHAPHTLAEKARPYDEAPSGIPGVEHLLPLALEWWRAGHFGLERLIALTSGNAARFLGLPKGALEPGRDGDVVLVDPDAEWTVAAGDDRVESLCAWTPYAGMHLRGRPEVTIVGGRVAWARHEADHPRRESR